MFRADLLKKVCGVVDPTVWSGEDLVLSQIYSVHCDRIAVVNRLIKAQRLLPSYTPSGMGHGFTSISHCPLSISESTASLPSYMAVYRYPLAYERLSDLQPADMVQSGHSVKETGGLVSVVIPAYNMEKYIERCLSSVLRSSYPYNTCMPPDTFSHIRICLFHPH